MDAMWSTNPPAHVWKRQVAIVKVRTMYNFISSNVRTTSWGFMADGVNGQNVWCKRMRTMCVPL